MSNMFGVGINNFFRKGTLNCSKFTVKTSSAFTACRIYRNYEMLGVYRYMHSSRTITVRFMQSDAEYSQSQAIYTPVQKGACAVIQRC